MSGSASNDRARLLVCQALAGEGSIESDVAWAIDWTGERDTMEQKVMGRTKQMARRAVFRQFLTNLDQPMPLPEKVRKLTGNLWRRVALRQTCCGHPGEPGC